MAYCTLGDLEALMRINFTAATDPTATEVEQMITDIAAEIDGVLQAAGYTVPVTAAQAVQYLRKMNTFGAGPEAWYAYAMMDSEPPNVAYWRARYERFLEDIREGKLQLPGLEPLGEEQAYFGIAPGIQRDSYWLTDQRVDPNA